MFWKCGMLGNKMRLKFDKFILLWYHSDIHLPWIYNPSFNIQIGTYGSSIPARGCYVEPFRTWSFMIVNWILSDLDFE